MSKEWIKWEPFVPGIEGNYRFDNISDNENGFKLVISQLNSEKKLEITFVNSIWAYKRTSESFRQNLFNILSEKYGDDFYTEWSFFKVTESDYLQWLSVESNTVTDQLKLSHFVIMTIDDVIDIAANYEPEIKFI